MKMIWVEGGDFYMGSIDDDSNFDEKDIRLVTLDGFYMGMLEVTKDQWQKIMGKGDGGDNPATGVSWEDAVEFCRRLSIKTGKNYKLPTEAQWEYAARGGKNGYNTKYAGSDNIKEVAWYEKSIGKYSDGGYYYIKNLHKGGQKKANELGIYDMSGNVYEWCLDWYAEDYLIYDTYNPQGPTTGIERVLRGGHYESHAEDCRVSNRYFSRPSSTWEKLGFRVVCIP
jgi:formylglycine-generating enzyme required for sulfatase activity